MVELLPQTRRGFLTALTKWGATVYGASLTGSLLAGTSEKSPTRGVAADCHPQIATGQEEIAILIYPGFTAIDAIGPEYILSGMMGAKVRLVAKTANPVKCETGFEVVPQLTFEDCPKKQTLLLVPGGTAGALQALEDPETISFIRELGGSADYVGSVCTGSLLLGAAGLLSGYTATSHWQTLELLPLVGATASRDRVVIDRNRVTGAGVTAGIDLALRLVQIFRGDFYAKGMQLLAQYDPQPLFPGGGEPGTADPAVVALLEEMHKPFVELIGRSVEKTFKAPPPS